MPHSLSAGQLQTPGSHVSNSYPAELGQNYVSHWVQNLIAACKVIFYTSDLYVHSCSHSAEACMGACHQEQTELACHLPKWFQDSNVKDWPPPTRSLQTGRPVMCVYAINLFPYLSDDFWKWWDLVLQSFRMDPRGGRTHAHYSQHNFD